MFLISCSLQLIAGTGYRKFSSPLNVSIYSLLQHNRGCINPLLALTLTLKYYQKINKVRERFTESYQCRERERDWERSRPWACGLRPRHVYVASAHTDDVIKTVATAVGRLAAGKMAELLSFGWHRQRMVGEWLSRLDGHWPVVSRLSFDECSSAEIVEMIGMS